VHQSTGEAAAVDRLAPSGRQPYPVFYTLADFIKGHPSLSTKCLEELIYILNGLPGLPLRVTIVIFIYLQLINGSGCS
jgi:hypothetical protein